MSRILKSLNSFLIVFDKNETHIPKRQWECYLAFKVRDGVSTEVKEN